jgi:hypothetical protein
LHLEYTQRVYVGRQRGASEYPVDYARRCTPIGTIKDGNVLVTLNTGDYPSILREWAATGRRHAGIVLLHGLGPADFDAIVETLQRRFAELPKQNDWVDRAVVGERATLTSR